MAVQILKALKHIITIPLCKLINLCIRQKTFPNCLKIARTVSVYKKGPTEDVANYRPISILPIISKVFEEILKKQINSYFETYGLFNPGQFGFRSNMSTTSAINYLTTYIQSCFEEKSFAQATFMDLTKAFDCVSHPLLIRKLQEYNFSDDGVNLIDSYLSNRLQYVSYNGMVSGKCHIKYGVPQGSVLGPILFLIYINDISACIADEADIVLFADDTTILERANSLELLEGRVGHMHDRVSDWFAVNALSVNETKTQTLCFSLRPNIEAGSVKFLGVVVDSGLTWEEHAIRLAGKLNRGVFMMRSLRKIVSGEVLLSAYYGYFHSHMLYAVLCWGHSVHATKVFAVQRRCIRVLAGLGYRDCCRQAFVKLNMLTFPCIYILTCLLYIKRNTSTYTKTKERHNHDTRKKENFIIPYSRTARARDGVNYYAIKVYNILPESVKSLSIAPFRNKMKAYLISKAFYNIEEYLNNCFDDVLL